MDTITVRVVSGLTGECLSTLTGIHRQTSVRNLKVQLEPHIGIPVREQQLLRANRALLDLQKLSCVLSGSVLELACVRLEPTWAEFLEQVRRGSKRLERLTYDYRNNRGVVMAAIQADGHAVRYAGAELRNDREVLEAAVQVKPSSLQFVTADMKADRGVVLAAVQHDGEALEFAAEELRGDLPTVLAAVQNNWRSLRFATPELRADPDLVLAALRKSSGAVQYAADSVWNDHAFVLAAVRVNGAALQFARPQFQSDREIVLAAVKSKSYSLQWAAEGLRSDRAFVLELVAKYGNAALPWVLPTTLAADPEIRLAAAVGPLRRLPCVSVIVQALSRLSPRRFRGDRRA